MDIIFRPTLLLKKINLAAAIKQSGTRKKYQLQFHDEMDIIFMLQMVCYQICYPISESSFTK